MCCSGDPVMRYRCQVLCMRQRTISTFFWRHPWHHLLTLARATQALAISALVHVNATLSWWNQRLCSLIRDLTRNQPGPCRTLSNSWPLTVLTSWLWPLLTLTFVLTFDQKLKFPKRPILLSFLHRFRFWTLFLHLKHQNWSFGTFFIMVSSKAFFKASSRDLLTLIQPQAFIKLLPWVWGRVLEIY